jgi:hypothetical protein
MRSAPACDALRGASTTWSVVRGWLARDALAVGGWWFTSTLSQSAVHGTAACDPLLRSGALAMGLRFLCVGGWGGSQEWAFALLGARTPSKNPASVSRMKAYIAYLLPK